MKKENYQLTIYAAYFGYITQAIVVNLPTLLYLIFRDTYGIPLSKITLLITFNFVTQLLVDYLSAKLLDRVGYRPAVLAAHIFSAAGLISLSILPDLLPSPYVGLLIADMLYAVGGGLIEVLISPIVEACPTDNKAGVMSLLHSFYAWGAMAVVLLSTLFFFLAGKENWRWLPCLWAILPIGNTFFFAKVPIARLTEEGEGMTVRELGGTGLFWLFVVLMIASGASEQGMVQWASAFAESGLGVTKTVGDLMGPCLFSALMGCARVFYAKMSEKVNLLNFLIGCSAACVGTFVVASLSPSPLISLIACAGCGLTVGIMWPGVFSLASASFRKGGTALFALLALAGDLGCASGPSAVGFLSGLLGDNLKRGLIFGGLFPAAMLVCAIVFRKKYEGKGE